MPRPKQRTAQLRDHVTSVAAGVLARDGVSGFTTRRIAAEAHTSTPAVYELFGDKRGLVRELFFDGFRQLYSRLNEAPRAQDPRADLVALVDSYRDFIRENPVLAEVMFSRPFSDFAPTAPELRAGSSVRKLIVTRVRRCIDAGVMRGDETDIAHVLVALVQGLALAEQSRRLGSSRASVERRWKLAVDAAIAGMGAR